MQSTTSPEMKQNSFPLFFKESKYGRDRHYARLTSTFLVWVDLPHDGSEPQFGSSSNAPYAMDYYQQIDRASFHTALALAAGWRRKGKTIDPDWDDQPNEDGRTDVYNDNDPVEADYADRAYHGDQVDQEYPENHGYLPNVKKLVRVTEYYREGNMRVGVAGLINTTFTKFQ